MKKINKDELHRIFEGIKNNNELEFNNLCEKYAKLIYSIAFSIIKNKEDSEEITQIIFMKIYKLEKEKLPMKNEASWLYSITKNEAISLCRKKREYTDIEKIYEIEDENDELNKIIEKIEFNKLISKLNNKEKEIVSLKILSNLSFEEISKLLNEPTGTIKWRYYKAVHALQILISNIGMFILTFIIGIKTMLKSTEQKKQANMEQLEDENNNEVIKDEIKDSSETNKKTENSQKYENNRLNIENNLEDKNEIIDSTITTEIIENKKDNNYYLGIGSFILSFIFLIFAIVTLIFYKIPTKNKK